MRLCFALLYMDADHARDDPAAHLARVRVAHDLPRSLADRGHDIDVVHLHGIDTHFEREGVRHHFVSPGLSARACARMLTLGTRSERKRALVTPAWGAITRIQSLRPDLVHFFGTSLHLNLALLSARLGALGPPVVLHHHGGRPATNPLSRRLQRFGFRRSRRVLFTTGEQSDTFRNAGLVDANRQSVQMVEGSSTFQWRSRDEARRATGMGGVPVCVSTARLAPPKDPHTVLRGFQRIATDMPNAHLYLYYQSDDLLPALKAWVGDQAALGDRVHFRGTLPYPAMEDVYNSADFLLQATHHEHSGFAVLDAMACGVIPIVSDIPSFRAMTDGGRVGGLFAAGDRADAELAERVTNICRRGVAAASDAVRAHFEQSLSYQALAQQLDREYRQQTRSA